MLAASHADGCQDHRRWDITLYVVRVWNILGFFIFKNILKGALLQKDNVKNVFLQELVCHVEKEVSECRPADT